MACDQCVKSAVVACCLMLIAAMHCADLLCQESHCSPVHQMAFNHTDPSLNNLFATVGKDQVRAVCVRAPACVGVYARMCMW